jgi:hypothetical protein
MFQLLVLGSNRDLRQLAYVRVCDGPDLASINRTKGSFDINAGQWTWPTETAAFLSMLSFLRLAVTDLIQIRSLFLRRQGPSLLKVCLRVPLEVTMMKSTGSKWKSSMFTFSVHPVGLSKVCFTSLYQSAILMFTCTGIAGDPSPKRKRAAFTYDKVPESSKTTASSSKDTEPPEPVQSLASGSSSKTHKTCHGQNAGGTSTEASGSG